MSLKNGVSILECISNQEKLGEGAMLKGFLEIAFPEGYVEFDEINNKNDFFTKLRDNNSKVVHISCHGDHDEGDNFYIQTPDGSMIFPEDFSESDRLRGRCVVLTGCSLGRKNFADEFLKRTYATKLIAPVKTIDSLDAAMWCANFYYHLIKSKNHSFGESYDYMKKHFIVKGEMRGWQRIEDELR